MVLVSDALLLIRRKAGGTWQPTRLNRNASRERGADDGGREAATSDAGGAVPVAEPSP